MTAGFRIDVESTLSSETAWERLWDLQRHSVVIPLTTVTLDPPATALAQDVEFRGRTGLGPLGFDDTMRVTHWQPPSDGSPGRAVMEKTSRVLGGRIEVDIIGAGSGSRVSWHQELRLPWLPSPLRALERVAAMLAAPGYRQVIRRLLAS